MSPKKIILIDPARNPQQYLNYSKEHNAQVKGVIETDHHADFVSMHWSSKKSSPSLGSSTGGV